MNDDIRSALDIINDYEGYLEFMNDCDGYDLETISYSRWALSEIKSNILKYQDQKSVSPVLIVECFIDEMDKFGFIARKNNKESYIFSVACEVGWSIIDQLNSIY